MSNISIRLPEDLETRLGEEAQRTHKKRSELAREAIADYLQRVERERLLADMVRAARVLYANPETRQEGLQIAEEGLEEWLESIEAEERAAGIDPDEKWWE